MNADPYQNCPLKSTILLIAQLIVELICTLTAIRPKNLQEVVFDETLISRVCLFKSYIYLKRCFLNDCVILKYLELGEAHSGLKHDLGNWVKHFF